MKIKIGQQQALEQKLHLTQEMRQSLAVLQLPLFDLQQYINDCLKENPILERKENTAEEIIDMSSSIDNHYDLSQRDNKENREFDSLRNQYREETFTEYLLKQLEFMNLSEKVKSVCKYLIQDLDDRGYLQQESIKAALGSKLPHDLVEESIRVIKKMDPAGVGATNLQECLILQATRNGENSQILKDIINCDLELLAQNKIGDIAERRKITMQEAKRYIDIIHGLNPIPSRGFSNAETTVCIIPEGYIEVENGNIVFRMNKNIVPTLYVSSYYKKLLQKKEDKALQTFLKENIQKAMIVVKGLTERENTLERVIHRILERQKVYFIQGKEFLQPMSMASLAKDLKLHESTVSRAVKNKYVVCPYGLISLKELFSVGLSIGRTGRNISSKAAKEILVKLIEQENKKKPLTDKELVMLMWRKGVRISRRTVAKYRGILNLPSANERK
jgi:RNA polymerase sigma-54 factor